MRLRAHITIEMMHLLVMLDGLAQTVFGPVGIFVEVVQLGKGHVVVGQEGTLGALDLLHYEDPLLQFGNHLRVYA